MELSSSNLPSVPAPNVKFEDEITESASPVEYSEVPLEVVPEHGAKKKKQPRRILHFSDGILEEYSTDEEDDEVDAQPTVDPRTLAWLPWFWHYLMAMSFGALASADYCGEKLAWFFGITSPKYQYAIDEHRRMQLEDEEEKEREVRETEADRARIGKKLSKLEDGFSDTNSNTTSTSSDPSLSMAGGAENPGFAPEKF